MSRILVRSFVPLAALLAFSGGGAGGQAPLAFDAGPAAQRQQARDSARVLRGARGAQASFERTRFYALPWTEDTGGGSCRENRGEIIGRFCFTQNDDEEDWEPPAEKEAVTRARDRLLGELAEAAGELPGDGWVAGQRVRYLLEAGRTDEAMAAARACRGEPGWCRALEGWVLHHTGRFAEAEAAFEAALAAMPERERRAWSDISDLLPAEDARLLRRTTGIDKVKLERRLWWLADPLWMEPGNDRRSEHFARWVADGVQERARTPEGWGWGEDLREILVRFGTPTGWERIRPPMHHSGRPPVVAHFAPRSWDFFPAAAGARELTTLTADGWRLDEEIVRSRHTPAYAGRAFAALDHQVAVFRRGDSAVVVAGWAMDSLPAAPRVQAALVLAPDEETAPVVSRAAFTAAEGALMATVPWTGAVMSLEAREDSGRAARARYWLAGPAEMAAASSLLLLRDPQARPGSLYEAVGLARPHARFRPGEPMAVYWEIYGEEGRSDERTVSLSLSRRTSGGLRRVGERLGVVRSASPVRMRWSEQVDAAVQPRAVTVALPADLPPGTYLLELTLRRPDGTTVTSGRDIVVERAR